MKIQGLLNVITVVGLLVGTIFGLTACGMKGSEMDAAGMTRSDVERLSLESQFGLMSARYQRMQDLLEQAQLRVADVDTTWVWISSGIAPAQGTYAPTPLDGATSENSYFMQAIRAVRLPGSTGARQDLDPLLEYFDEQGWAVAISGDSERGWTAKTVTADGYRMSYQVQPNGQYNLDVVSDGFWGDRSGLLEAVVNRVPTSILGTEESLPGEYEPFPEWSDTDTS